MVVKRVVPMSVAKVSAALYAILGLVFGGIISVISFAGQALAPDAGDGGMRSCCRSCMPASAS
jgi:hypothetical protein